MRVNGTVARGFNVPVMAVRARTVRSCIDPTVADSGSHAACSWCRRWGRGSGWPVGMRIAALVTVSLLIAGARARSAVIYQAVEIIAAGARPVGGAVSTTSRRSADHHYRVLD